MSRLLFLGDDWAEEYHDVELQDEAGRRLGTAKLAEGIAGIARLHAMIGEHVDEDAGPVEVVVGIETDRGSVGAGAGRRGLPGVSNQPCGCREFHPCSSGGMFVFVEESAETIASADMQPCDRGGVGHRLGQRTQGPGVRDAPMGTVTVMVPLVLPYGVQKMHPIPEQHPVEQFVAAGLDPPFHDRVHARHPHTAEHDGDAGVGEDRVEQGRVLPVAVTDEVPDLVSDVVEIHDEVAGRLGHPVGGRVRGGAEDANSAGGLVDDGQDVQPGAGQRPRFEEVGGQDGVGLGA